MTDKPKTAFEASWGTNPETVPRCYSCPLYVANGEHGGNCRLKPEPRSVSKSHWCGSHPFHAANLARVTGRALAIMQHEEAKAAASSIVIPPSGLRVQ